MKILSTHIYSTQFLRKGSSAAPTKASERLNKNHMLVTNSTTQSSKSLGASYRNPLPSRRIATNFDMCRKKQTTLLRVAPTMTFQLFVFMHGEEHVAMATARVSSWLRICGCVCVSDCDCVLVVVSVAMCL